MATVVGTKNGEAGVLQGVPLTNDGEDDILLNAPRTVFFELQGTAPILWHRWSNEAVAEKAAAGKNTKAKKSDNLESYVWRNEEGEICIPGEYVRMSVVNAARFFPDPRSPRKSLMDLAKAAVISLTELAPILTEEGASTEWDFVDARRVTIQRSAITRQRPGHNTGWKAQFDFQLALPQYIDPQFFLKILTMAGSAVGLADFRPSYGRFVVTRFDEVVPESPILY